MPNFDPDLASARQTQIVNQQTGLCLDVPSTTAGARVIAAVCNGSRSQLWVVAEQGPYTFTNLNSQPGNPLLLTATVGTPSVVLAVVAEPDSLEEELQLWKLERLFHGAPGAAVPATKDECKKGGWRNFSGFKNEGDCVSFVATGGKNEAGPNQPSR
jgi:hypothetical protein